MGAGSTRVVVRVAALRLGLLYDMGGSSLRDVVFSAQKKAHEIPFSRRLRTPSSSFTPARTPLCTGVFSSYYKSTYLFSSADSSRQGKSEIMRKRRLKSADVTQPPFSLK
jgi:hypothetical protein